MDVSPKTLREVEFREKMRGYHPEDVDQFLERVAAGIEVLQDRLRQALERVQRAEAQASEVGGADDTLRRTLVLAQRTADLAVQEAREQAARILAGAEQQAQAMIAEAEDRARRAHEDKLADVRSQLGKLETTRQQLQLDVETLTRWVEEHKVHLSSALHDALARIEQTELLSPPPKDRVDAMPVRSALSGSSSGPAGSSAAPAPAAGGGADAAPSQPGATGDRRQELRDAGEQDAGGPPTMAWRPDQDEPEPNGGQRDPYFAELRRAINQQGPPGPRSDEEEPHAVAAVVSGPGEEFFDQDLADVRRFGGRLRRRH
jgi:cell division initiation protein